MTSIADGNRAPQANHRHDQAIGNEIPVFSLPRRSGGVEVPATSVAACSGNSSLGGLGDPPSAAALCAFGRVNPLTGLGLLPDLGKAGAAAGGTKFLSRCQSFAHGHKVKLPRLILLCATKQPRLENSTGETS